MMDDIADCSYGYVLLLRRDSVSGEIYVDSFLDVSPVMGENLMVLKLRSVHDPAALNGVPLEICRTLEALGIRAKYNHGHLVLIKTEDESSIEELEEYCKLMSQNPQEFRLFLKEASI
jgi:hypothetical protein